MKKFFAVFLMMSVLAVLALPVMAAVGVQEQPPSDKTLPTTPPAQTGGQLLTLVDTATNWLFAIFAVLAVIFVLLAAFQFISAGGDAVKLGEARQKLIWAAIGIVIALASKGLVPVIRSIIGA